MKAKCIVLIIVSFVLCAVSFAQEYSIRANRGLNLRAAPSRTAAIADTVHAGAVLQVVGEFNRWLKINRNGREVWLADWVDYSRVDGVAPTGPQPQQPPAPAGQPINNCCNVDRQCHSDQEWLAGYWAYQNGQCAAPAQPQPATPAQPVASAPATVDNCCQVDRNCQSELDWMGGWHAFQNGQCFAPVQTAAGAPGSGGNCCSLGWDCPTENERVLGAMAFQRFQCADPAQTSAITLTGPVPRIEGSGQFRQHITATLKLMKKLAPAWYNYVITGLDSIVEEPVHVEPWQNVQRAECGAFANSRERKARVQTCFMRNAISGWSAEFDQEDTAAALGHEACHVHVYEEGKHFASLDDEEALCGKMGTGASVLIRSAFAAGLNPNRGTAYFKKDLALNVLRRYCSEGYRRDLFCPTLQRLESDWRNVPYAEFPPKYGIRRVYE